VDEKLTVREGRVPSGGPYEGVPSHLRAPLENWLAQTYRYVPNGAGRVDDDRLLMVAAGLRIAVTHGSSGNQLYLEVSSQASRDDESLLDFIHATVQIAEDPAVGTLSQILMHGGSVWTAEREMA
jgi:hypothetical protein